MDTRASSGIADVVRAKLKQARDQLIQRNLRNKLLNCALTSKRSRQVRVVDELADEVFKLLWNQRREMTFAPGRGLQTEDAEEAADPDYGVWIPPEGDEADEEGVSRRHRDRFLQTQLTAEGLQKRLTSLYYESIESEEEQGVNVLYLALGFVKWFEDGRSEVERYAPLVLLPVELVRKGARERFQLKARDEDLYANVSLKIWLSEQHSIELPELPESDDWLPSTYFEAVRRAIAGANRWEVVESEILLGFFSFNKFLLWRDLDPDNWPNPDQLLGHSVLRSLLAPYEERGQADSPVIPEDGRIDEYFKAGDQVTILDSDSSQTRAIQMALSGRDLVIQGPPGTGKSQTIANIVAAAVHKGKSVLFVAEKLAALQVVYDRLREVGLSPLCFELHSRRASKNQVLAQLREALEAGAPPAVPQSICENLDKVVTSLWEHSDRVHRHYEPSGYTPYQVIGGICRLQDEKVPPPDYSVRGADTWSAVQIETFLDEIGEGAQRLLLAGVPARHPWRECARGEVNPLDGQRLASHVRELSAALDALVAILRSVWPLVRPSESSSLQSVEFSEIPRVVQALKLAAAKPGEPVELLCNPRWTDDLNALGRLVEVTQQLASIERNLESVFTDAAWTHEWTVVRSEIGGSGQSLLRFLRSGYREAVRTYRGVCKSTLPDGYAARVEALDQLIRGQHLRAELKDLESTFGDDLKSIWPSLPGGWQRLSTLAAWLRETSSIEPRLSVRNARLLGWSEQPGTWAERLSSALAGVVACFKTVSDVVQLVRPESRAESAEIPYTLGELLERVRGWSTTPERFNEWPSARDFVGKLREAIGAEFAEKVYVGKVPPAELRGRVKIAILEQVWNRMCQEDGQLSRIDGRTLDGYVHLFRSLDQDRVRAAASEVARRHFDCKPTGSVGEMGIVRMELNKSRNHLAVRKLLDRAGSAIQALKPVFLMSPLSVAQYLAPGKLEFDLLLIDEASQVRPEDALGAVARAKQIVVVGDTKQLPPTNFFNRLVQDGDGGALDETEFDGSADLGAMESILSLCDATLPDHTMLRWHYRSQHPALIAVSNHRFYDDKLLLPPSISTGQASDGLGIAFHRVASGGYDRGRSATNVLEADRVAEAVCRFARETPEKSLGVGTFSAAQRDVIRDRIEAHRRDSPELESFFATSRSAPFFVKNLESIQGDERDVIFISVGYGRDRDGRLTQSFGPINGNGGERRLNVLISRAKERCEVFSSITGDDIDVSNHRPGTVALKQFLQYAEKGYLDVPKLKGKTFDSDFEESVANFLSSRGYTVHPQVGMAGFYIDLGVLSPDGNRYVLGIECDGATYHSSRSARDRDRIRQQILESRGWRIHRIWSTDWFNRRSSEENRLLDGLQRAERTGGAKGPAARIAEPPPQQEAKPLLPVTEKSSESVMYVESSFKVRCNALPHEAPNQVREAVRRIVDQEGPIHAEEVGRRVATVWGLDRAGARIQEAARRALRALERSGTVKSEGAFWLGAESEVVVVRDRSQTESATLRKPEYLPPKEIAVAATQILKENIRVEEQELVVEIARRLGFHRTGQGLWEVIRSVLEDEKGGNLEAEDGWVMLSAEPKLT